ncbi:helix-turn-helix domain-containing protein [Mycobacterium sp.]|uniref:IclR family transcriptional regulator n=1 Tax=Mycobacterium sp. TaxID=1785 RepID=UPI0012016A44|nr:helix-turn-helix domain-containing protein [Mycobacterium sp.]TAM64845.1 MAG: MarR family transcriptional regulator [Mycobacterium sp.]
MAQPHDEGERAGSPPTDRVVAIVELLAGQSEPSSVASIASRLELNRSTVTSILLALERAGWAARQPDRRYTLGPGLFGVAEAVRNSLPLPERFTDALAQLAQRAGCGATLALVGATEMTFLGVVGGQGLIPPGVGVGVRLPLIAPVGAAVIAHRDTQARTAWLASTPAARRPVYQDVLTQVRRNGVAVFGLGDSDPEVLNVLGEIAELLAEHPQRSALRQRVFELLIGLGANPYTAQQLTTTKPLSVSYLIAPVFNADGRAVYELQLGPLRSSVTAAERKRFVGELRATATELSRH